MTHLPDPPAVLTRRRLLRVAGSSAALAAGSGLGLFGGKAPARADVPQLHVLEPNSFMPAIDAELQGLADQFAEAQGVRVKLELINQNDLLPRAVAAVEARYGPDVILLPWNRAWRFGAAFAPLDAAAEAMGGARIYAANRAAVRVDGAWRGVPYYNIGSAMTYNTALLAQQGLTRLPESWNELLQAGARMKQAGWPVGWSLGRTLWDAAAGSYPLLWAFGGAEVDERGRVILDSRETRAALEWFRQFWHDACDPAGLDWGETGNNEAFRAQRASVVLNPASICLKARTDGDAALADAIRHTPMPAGPAGRFHLLAPFNHHVPAYAKNGKLALEWLRFLAEPANYGRVFRAGGGFVQGVTPEWDADPLWEADGVLKPFRELNRLARPMGARGPYNLGAAQVHARFVLRDLFADAVQQGGDAALARAGRALADAYGAG